MEWMTTIDTPGKTYLMQGNEAVVRGAIEAHVDFCSSYPGSPSSQILMMLGNNAKKMGYYAEWSTNETVAFEAALGACFTGARALCIVKQNGLLFLGDALHCGAMQGIKGGLVLITSDDPGSHSSTNEFDSRHQAISANVPMLEPTCMQEAKDFIPFAFELSEKLKQLVVIRLTTRVCHGRGNVTVGEIPKEKRAFDVKEWDRMLCVNLLHPQLLYKLDNAKAIFNDLKYNTYQGPENAENLIVAGGTGKLYTMEALEELGLTDKVGLLALATVWPCPDELVLKYLTKAKRVLVMEEVDPFLERCIAAIAGKHQLQVEILGRDAGELLPRVGELDPDVSLATISAFMGLPAPKKHVVDENAIELPERELSFCAGCPHRATFFLLKKAIRRQNLPVTVVGDIGCYTIAGQKAGQYGYQFNNCMGSGVAAASGLGHLQDYGFDQHVVTMSGDSTFFHSILPALVNAKYSNANMLYIVLDNSATAMTGFQPHPGTGLTAMGDHPAPMSIEHICEALGCDVTITDPFDIDATLKIITDLIPKPGVKVLISRQPCATLAMKTRAKRKVYVDPNICQGDNCGCGRFCSRVWGCPGNSFDFKAGKAVIDEVSCIGCGVCADLCPNGAIKIEGRD